LDLLKEKQESCDEPLSYWQAHREMLRDIHHRVNWYLKDTINMSWNELNTIINMMVYVNGFPVRLDDAGVRVFADEVKRQHAILKQDDGAYFDRVNQAVKATLELL